MSDWNHAPRPRPSGATQQRPNPGLAPQWVPDGTGVFHWWDGAKYTGQKRVSPEQERMDNTIRGVIGGIVGLLVVIGGFLNLQETNLLEGSTNIWIGAALVGAGFIFCCAPKRLHWGAMVGVGILAALAIANAVYVEKQLADKRDELNDVFNGARVVQLHSPTEAHSNLF